MSERRTWAQRAGTALLLSKDGSTILDEGRIYRFECYSRRTVDGQRRTPLSHKTGDIIYSHGGVPVGGVRKRLRLTFRFYLEEDPHRFLSTISRLGAKKGV